MRFGLVGTGPWARIAHGPGLASAEDIDLVGVWGRDPDRTAALARDLATVAYDDFAAMLHDVDAVAFSVPPDVQATMAIDAARAGKHLLLDKPVATDTEAAQALVQAVEAAGVASVVFFTDRFSPGFRGWCEHVRRTGGWRGGWTTWLTFLDHPGNPYRDSVWRRERGVLWDIGPHALSTLGATLGPVCSLTAAGGRDDTVTLILRHEGGATSTATLTLSAPPSAVRVETTLWGDAGFSTMPARSPGRDGDVLAVAARELVAAARTGERHPIDVAFGARVVELLALAQTQLDAEA